MPKAKKDLISLPDERIIRQIYLIRGKKVMLDRDLGELYGVTTGNLNKAVRRNIERFPENFMFQLTKKEMGDWIFQFGRSNRETMGMRKPPLVFTEHGVLMISNVLKSKRAIQVSLQIVNTFVKLREMLTTNTALRRKIEAMEKKYDKKYKLVLKLINHLIAEDEKPKKQIGFKVGK